MTPSEQFISEIDAFLERSGMKATAFGWDAVKDPNFVRDLKTKGRSPSLALVERVHDFIKSQEANAQ